MVRALGGGCGRLLNLALFLLDFFLGWTSDSNGSTAVAIAEISLVFEKSM
jgi:hypothetical protein